MIPTTSILKLISILQILILINLKEFKINEKTCSNSLKRILGTQMSNKELIMVWTDICDGENIITQVKKYDEEGNVIEKQNDISINLHDTIFLINNLLDGGFAIFTGSNDNDSYNIWASTFDSQINQLKYDVNIMNVPQTRSQQRPVCLNLNNGNFLIIIVKLQQLPFTIQNVVSILGKIYDKDLTPVTQSMFLINQNKFIYDADLRVVNSLNGGFVVIWRKQDGTSFKYDVCMRSYDSSGEPLTEEINLNFPDNITPHIASRLKNGNFILSYIHTDGNYARIFTPLGTEVTPEFLLFQRQDNYSANIVSLTNGKILVTWQSGEDLKGNLFDEGGKLIKIEIKVNSATISSFYDQNVIPTSNGNFIITWSSNNKNNENLGLYAQFFDSKGFKIDPAPLVCTDAIYTFPANSTISIGLNKNVKTSLIKLQSLPVFGTLFYGNENVILNENYELESLQYRNDNFTTFDYFNFSSVDGFNEGSFCKVNLTMYDNIPISQNISLNLNQHENIDIDFTNYVSDRQEEIKDLKIGFNKLPSCGKLFSNNKEITDTDIIFKTTNLFTFKSLNCVINFFDVFEYFVINSFNKTSHSSEIKISITKPLPFSESFTVYVDREKDKSINFSSHVSDEFTPLNELKIIFPRNPVCGRLFDADMKEIIVNKIYLVVTQFMYKTSSCRDSNDLLIFEVINDDLFRSQEKEVNILIKNPPNTREITISVVEMKKSYFKFDKNKVNDIEEPYHSLKIIFTQYPFQGDLYYEDTKVVKLDEMYSIMNEFSYVSVKKVIDNSEDIFMYSAVNSYELSSKETRIIVKINPQFKWWTTPMSIMAFIFSGCAAVGGFIFTLCKCKAKGFCCCKKKKLNDNNKTEVNSLQPLVENENVISL